MKAEWKILIVVVVLSFFANVSQGGLDLESFLIEWLGGAGLAWAVLYLLYWAIWPKKEQEASTNPSPESSVNSS